MSTTTSAPDESLVGANQASVFKGVATLDDILKIEAIPLEDRDIPETVLDAFKLGGGDAGDNEALVFIPDGENYEMHHRWTFAQFIAEIERTAAGLQAVSDVESPTISFLLPNLPETIFSLWAAASIGKVNPVNPLLEPQQIAEILNAAEADIVVTINPVPGADLFEKTIAAVADVPSIKTIITIDPARYVGGLKGAIGSLLGRFKAKAPGKRLVPFNQLQKMAPSTPPVFTKKADDVCALFHTGGTTGTPKLAQLTHRNLVTLAWAATENRVEDLRRRNFTGLPLFHINAVTVNGICTWIRGGSCVLGPPQGYRAKGVIPNLWKIVEYYKIAAMSGVPTIYQALLDYPNEGIDISSLEAGFCGAAPISKPVFNRIQKKTGIRLLEGYGFTEGAGITATNPFDGESRIGSVGLRQPYQEVTIFVETDEGQYRHGAPNEIGIIGVRGPNIFKGYVRPEDDAKAWVPDPDGGQRWYNTGDMGRIDEDGYIWLTGRKKELIIRGGHNIDPGVIEEAIAKHPDVDIVAAIPSPAPRVGEMPVAYVTARQGAQIDEETLLAHVQPIIPERAAIPKRIFVVDDVPLTAIGKIFKPELKMRETDRVVTDLLTPLLPDTPFTVLTERHLTHGQRTTITLHKESVDPQTKERVTEALLPYSIEWTLAAAR